jgi:hypothetical protein
VKWVIGVLLPRSGEMVPSFNGVRFNRHGYPVKRPLTDPHAALVDVVITSA